MNHDKLLMALGALFMAPPFAAWATAAAAARPDVLFVIADDAGLVASQSPS